MYTSSAVASTATGVGVLAVTGFSIASFIIVGVILIVGGMLLLRVGRRRAAHR
jgi:hypothetical protein